ncbi:MAG: B12-binding domain-containing radical SAM protein [Phycisphaeraceae bacterium]|nr:B12-binding domain-containing radical SAM protein [Phycisphaeraceae bacterium]
MKFGLIAMSGIRVCDSELLALGLTLPGFVERSKTIASLPSLGLLTLAGMTPKQHEVCYREVDQLPGDNMEDFDMVAISTFTAQAPEAYELADRYRAQGVPVVMGGLHVTCMADEAQEHCDAVVLGQGEPVWLDVLADAEWGKLQSIYDARQITFDLADAPMPAYELLDVDRYNRLTVQASRGCPWRCQFCASSILLTPHYHQKPAEKVLAEVDRICEVWKHPFIELTDDNAFVNRRYWKQLLPRLAERRIKWFAETDISVAEDEQLLGLLREAGCAEVLIGLESPSGAGLNGLEMHKNWKQQMQPDYESAVQRIQSHGIRVNGCFILGLDGQQSDVFDQVFEMADRLALYDVQITLPTPFPGTALYEQLHREGRLLENRPWRRCTLFDVTFQPCGMSVEDLRHGFHDLSRRLYGQQFTDDRRRRFNQQLRTILRDKRSRA